MPTLFCTKKVFAHLALKRGKLATREVEPTSARLGNWYANLIRLDRRTAVLYTNERTLFSFIMFRVRAKRPDLLQSGFTHGLTMALALEGHKVATIESVVAEYAGGLVLAQTSSQKVLASMNAIAQDMRHILWHKGGLAHYPVDRLVKQINSTPWKAIGFEYSRDLVAELLGIRRGRA